MVDKLAVLVLDLAAGGQLEEWAWDRGPGSFLCPRLWGWSSSYRRLKPESLRAGRDPLPHVASPLCKCSHSSMTQELLPIV